MIAETQSRRRELRYVVIDACVLANYAVADLLLNLADLGVIFPLWTEQILEETYRTHTMRLSWAPRFARSFRAALLRNFPTSLVSDYAQWIEKCTNHEKDRHVLACAIEGGASVIVTYNLRDFGARHLAPWRVRALHPQDYLLELHAEFPDELMEALRVVAVKHSARVGRKITVGDELAALAPFVPKFSQALLALDAARPCPE